MPNILKLTTGESDPADLLNAGAYGAGAVIRLQTATTQNGAYADVSGTGATPSVALVTGVVAYTGFDPNGISSSWYRTRYENAGATRTSDWTTPFPVTGPAPVGGYATLAGVKGRMAQAGQVFGSADDAVLQNLCDQANGWIESKTGRILMPYPTINTTITAGGAAGSTAVTLASAIGVNAGDALLFGPVTGTREHGIVVSVSGSVVTLQSALVATYANGTAVTRVLLFDGYDAAENGRLIPATSGIVAASSLEVAFYTGGAYSLIPATDWFLRPSPFDREPGWPATEVWMTDIPSAANAAPFFPRGLGNIRIACTPGWPAIPDEIVGLAQKLVVGAYRGRGSGGGNAVTIGVDGERVIEQSMTAQDWRLINAYRAKEVLII